MPIQVTSFVNADGQKTWILAVGPNANSNSVSNAWAVAQANAYVDANNNPVLVSPNTPFPIKDETLDRIQSSLLTIASFAGTQVGSTTTYTINQSSPSQPQQKTHKGVLLTTWVDSAASAGNVTSLLLQPEYRVSSSDPWFSWGEPERLDLTAGSSRKIDWGIMADLVEVRLTLISKEGSNNSPVVNHRWTFSDVE